MRLDEMAGRPCGKRFSCSRFPAGNSTLSSPSAAPPGNASPFGTPVLAKFKGTKEDEKENEAPGPDVNPTGA